MADQGLSKKGFQRHFHACNDHDISRFVPFYIETLPLGWILKDLKQYLLNDTDVFEPHQEGLNLHPRYNDFKSRSHALATVTDLLVKLYATARRHEMYPVIQSWGDTPLAEVDRIAVPWFGIKGFGIHVNGYVKTDAGLKMWIGERAMDRLIDPGKLDNMIGGGQPIGLSLQENLYKEAHEEAGFNKELITKAKLVQKLHYKVERHNGLRNDHLFIYDLEVPTTIQPHNTDGEVGSFHLMSLNEVADLVENTDRFKFNCNLVITDFLMRQKYFSSLHPEYTELQTFLAQSTSA